MGVTAILPQARPMVRTWLHFRFVTHSKATVVIPPAWLRHYEAERTKATARFLRDMARLHPDWQFLGQLAEAGGPYPAVAPRGVPKAPPKRPTHPGGRPQPDERGRDYAGYVADVPDATASDGWEWELKALFAHPAMMTEYLVD